MDSAENKVNDNMCVIILILFKFEIPNGDNNISTDRPF